MITHSSNKAASAVGGKIDSLIFTNVTAVPVPRATTPTSPSKSKHCT